MFTFRLPLCIAVLALLAMPFAGEATAADKMAKPPTVMDVFAKLNAMALDKDGKPTGKPTYNRAMAMIKSSGVIGPIDLALPCNTPATDGKKAKMVERPALTFLAPTDDAWKAVPKADKGRIASEPKAAEVFVAAHLIKGDASAGALNGMQVWFRTEGGQLHQFSRLQGTTVINPGLAAVWTVGEDHLCVGGPIFVILQVPMVMPYKLPEKTAMKRTQG